MAQAAAGFAARGDIPGEVRARASRLRLLSGLGRIAEGEADTRRVEELIPLLTSGRDRALAWMTQARFLTSAFQHYEQAFDLLRQACATTFSTDEIGVQENCLLDLGDTLLALGRYDASRDTFLDLQALARSQESGLGALAEAQGLYGQLRVLREASIDEPQPGAREEALRLANAALDAARRAQSRDVEAKALGILGLLEEGPAAREALDQCLTLAVSDSDRSFCSSALARIEADGDPKAAGIALDQAVASARRSTSLSALSYALREQVRLAWRQTSPDEAWSAAQADLAILESMRDLQPGAMSRASFFSTLSPHFYWIAGKLFQDAHTTGSAVSLSRAFEVAEHLRARTLIDALEHAGSASRPSSQGETLGRQREQVLREISDLQRRLVTGDSTRPSREPVLAALSPLEARERELEERIAGADPSYAGLRHNFADLDSVRAALAPDEALLSYLIAPWKDLRQDFAGGAWLLIATRSGARVVPLEETTSERSALRAQVRFLAGMVGRLDGREGPAAASLYRTLLAPVLDGRQALEPAIRKLILVPDDALHLLPFSLLRSGPTALPLAARFQVETVPSATLWLRFRRQRSNLGQQPALVLADPSFPGNGGRVPATQRAARFASDFRLGPLPFAREEGRAAAARLGASSELYVGEGASEARLKERLQRPFGLLHLAAHAVVDDLAPERSGILLTPGDAKEDGILQVREIVQLPLAGKVVVLSACRTGGGSVLRGEGVMGLARAFFQAGAHTVVASLWPLRDEAGAALFAAFYRQIGGGASVAEALRRAQMERRTAGAPAFDWAGVVVLGDGDLVPVPGGKVVGGVAALLDASWSKLGLWVWIGVTFLAAATVARLVWSRARRQRTE